MEFPAHLKYTEDHEWIRVEGDIAYIGVTDHAQKELGDIVYVEVETLDEELEQGDEFGAVEAVKTTAELYMPVSGKVLEFNAALEDNPELVNKSPYEDGWIIKIQMSAPDQIDDLLSVNDYTEKLAD